MDRTIGLYVTVDNGMLKRKLITKSGELTLNDISVGEAIIFFSELKFEYYSAAVELLNDIAAEIAEYPFANGGYMDEQKFFDFTEKIAEIVAVLEEEKPLQGVLTRTLLEEQIPSDDLMTVRLCTFSILPTRLSSAWAQR